MRSRITRRSQVAKLQGRNSTLTGRVDVLISSLAIHLNRRQTKPSMFLFGLLQFLWCFSIIVSHHLWIYLV